MARRLKLEVVSVNIREFEAKTEQEKADAGWLGEMILSHAGLTDEKGELIIGKKEADTVETRKAE